MRNTPRPNPVAPAILIDNIHPLFSGVARTARLSANIGNGTHSINRLLRCTMALVRACGGGGHDRAGMGWCRMAERVLTKTTWMTGDAGGG